MPVRRSATALAAFSLLVTLTLTGCGSDNKKADTTTTAKKGAAVTTTAAPSDGTDSTTEPAPTTTMSAGEFDAAIAKFNSTLDAAGGDFCKIALAANSLNLSDPSTPQQAEAAYKAFASVLTKVGDAAPAGVDGAKLKAAATKILDDAKADGYDPTKLTAGKGPAALDDPEIAKAMADVGVAIQKQCSPGDTGTGTDAG